MRSRRLRSVLVAEMITWSLWSVQGGTGAVAGVILPLMSRMPIRRAHEDGYLVRHRRCKWRKPIGVWPMSWPRGGRK